MKQKHKLYTMILLFSFFGLFGQNKKNKNKETTELKSGQIWEYNTRKGEEQSRIIILKIEDYGKRGKVIHIAVNGLKIKNKHVEGGISREFQHLPFRKKEIIKSLTKLEGALNNIPDFNEGYNMWKEAWENGTGGVFTITVKEVIELAEKGNE